VPHVTPVLLVALSIAGCRGAADTRIVQPGPPGSPSRTIPATSATEVGRLDAAAPDVRFMQRMIVHHAQALDMTALVRTRTDRQALLLLAERIEASQSDEIAFMREWLMKRGQEVPAAHSHHDGLMPGMLTIDELSTLAAARDTEFARRFLELMIRHHEGAIEMVEALFAAAGGQDSEVFEFASEVAADQRIEIQRMRTMAAELRP
jgi:uncharacterized protein (DUF305 family)